MDIKKISTLFKETHSVTHSSTRLSGDKKVNFALDSKIERESTFIRKKSVTVQAEHLFNSAFNLNCVQGEVPTDPANLTLSGLGEIETPPPSKFISEVKQDVKSKVLVNENDHTFDHVKTLVKQGKFLELTYIEKNDATWKSFLFNLPRGTMKFVLNSRVVRI